MADLYTVPTPSHTVDHPSNNITHPDPGPGKASFGITFSGEYNNKYDRDAKIMATVRKPF